MRIRNLTIASLSALLLALPGVSMAEQHKQDNAGNSAKTDTEMPQPEKTDGGVKYVTGGVGEAEAAAMEGRYHDYSFKLVNVRSGPEAAYVADVEVTVTDGQGNTVLDTTTKGPWLIADLPPGDYDIEASFDGKTQSESVTLNRDADQRLVLDWRT